MLNHSVLLRQLCLMSAVQKFIFLSVYKAIILSQININLTHWKEREMVGFYLQMLTRKMWNSRPVFKPVTLWGGL